MELADPFYARGEHFGIDLRRRRCVFTTRRGGYSRGPYASLNLGRLTDDDPGGGGAQPGAALEAELGVRLAFVRQVHGRRVCALSAATVGPQRRPRPAAQADGLVSAEPGLAATVLTADCLPIAIAGERAVAMVHAGWRGLAGGCDRRGRRARCARAGVRRQRCSAAIGPGAGPCCYEVGEELHERFADQPSTCIAAATSI